MSRVITVEEARRLGVYDRHCFSIAPDNYRGSGLYVIEFEKGIKIGVSKALQERLQVYKAPWCQSIKNLRLYKHSNPTLLEKFLKNYFVRNAGEKVRSTEFIVGNSFEFITQFIERNQFHTTNDNRKVYRGKISPCLPADVL